MDNPRTNKVVTQGVAVTKIVAPIGALETSLTTKQAETKRQFNLLAKEVMRVSHQR